MVFDDSRRKTSRRSSAKSARKKQPMPGRSVSSPCRWTGSKKSEEMLGPDYESKFSPKSRSKTDKPEIPVSVAADLCGINRTSIYYEAKPISDTELECKAIMDHFHTDNPTWGALQMSAQLKCLGHHIGRKKARKWMTEMGIDPIYPKPNLSKCLQRAAIVPYLLRNADITLPNQALVD